MNIEQLKKEINALRPFELGDDPYRHGQTDTIERVLDIVAKIEIQNCDHFLTGLIPKSDGVLETIEFTYCPKCGQKL